MNRLVVVSNRVPALAAAGPQAGGLTVALDALMERRGGLWFGWSGQIADAPAAEARFVAEGRVQYATIDLTPVEHDRYYNEFSNSTLWPLLHSMTELMTFDRRNAQVYREVNERFAAALHPLLRSNDLIWVHDYHLMALPALLRAIVIEFPWPKSMRFPAAKFRWVRPLASALCLFEGKVLPLDLDAVPVDEHAERLTAAHGALQEVLRTPVDPDAGASSARRP